MSELTKSEYEQDCKPLRPMDLRLDPAAVLRMAQAVVMSPSPHAVKEQDEAVIRKGNGR